MKISRQKYVFAAIFALAAAIAPPVFAQTEAALRMEIKVARAPWKVAKMAVKDARDAYRAAVATRQTATGIHRDKALQLSAAKAAFKADRSIGRTTINSLRTELAPLDTARDSAKMVVATLKGLLDAARSAEKAAYAAVATAIQNHQDAGFER